MALAFPEGECFFRRDGLISPRAGGYDARNERQFYSTMLVEFLWNVPSHSENAGVNYPNGHFHPRTGYTITRRDSRIRQGNYNNLPFSYGPSERQIRRRVQHELCLDPWTLQDYYFGNSVAHAFFMTIPLPTEEERWVWIDMVARIRAIYLPMAYTADEQHPTLCAFVQLNFAQERRVDIWRGSSFVSHAMHRVHGLNTATDYTVAFDVQGLIQLLAVPRQLRRANPYAMKFIKIVHRNNVNTVALQPSGTFRHQHDIEWTKVASANFGLEIQWKPTQRGTWLSNFLKNVLTFAIGLIPVVGPFLAIAFPLGWTAITDPDAFLDEMRNLMPGFDLTARIAEKIRESIKEQRKCLPDGWEALNFSSHGLAHISSEDTSAAEPPPDLEQIGRSLAFIIAEDVLANSALPRKDEPADDDDPDEIELVNQPTENPFETTACAKFSDTK